MEQVGNKKRFEKGRRFVIYSGEELRGIVFDMAEMARRGFDSWEELGRITARPSEDGELVILNYKREVQYEGDWNPYEVVSRGLILRRDGAIVARPFDKFWNWGEFEPKERAKISYVTEKMDGSLGIIYKHRGQICVATRGSFDSDQARWATEWIRQAEGRGEVPLWLSTFLDVFTPLVEIIYPANKIVVDYQGDAGLWLLDVRNMHSGRYFSRIMYDAFLRDIPFFRAPRRFLLSTVNEIEAWRETLSHNEEGCVAVMTDGSRWKFKGEKYRTLHKVLDGMTWNWAFELARDGQELEARSIIPEELLLRYDELLADIYGRRDALLQAAEDAYAAAPVGLHRKEFAAWVTENEPYLAPLLFMIRDGKNPSKKIWNMVKDQKKEETKDEQFEAV